MSRPKGSKNKNKFGKFTKKGRGRPVGSVNKKRTLADYGSINITMLPCNKCKTPTKAGGEAASVVCSACTQKTLPTPDWGYHKKAVVRDANAPKRKRGRPRTRPINPSEPKRPRGRPRTRPIEPPKPTYGWGKGWHMKKYFTAPNGKKFHFGKEVK